MVVKFMHGPSLIITRQPQLKLATPCHLATLWLSNFRLALRIARSHAAPGS